MSLSDRQQELRRQIVAQQQAEDEGTNDRPRLFSRLLILLSLAAGAYGGWQYYDVAMESGTEISDVMVVSLLMAFILSLIGGLLASSAGASAHFLAQRSGRATGVIISHHISQRPGSSASVLLQSLIVKVDFEVDGEPYVATVQPNRSYSNASLFLKYLKWRYPKGGTIEIAYNPEDPTDHDIPRSKLFRRLVFHAAKTAFYIGMAATGFLAGFSTVAHL